MLFDLLISAKTTLMPCVYNQAVRVAIGVDIGVVRAEEAGIEGIVVVEGLRGSGMMISVF